MFKPNEYDLAKEYCQRQEAHCERVRLIDQLRSGKDVILPTLRQVNLFSAMMIIVAVILLVAFFAMNAQPVAAATQVSVPDSRWDTLFRLLNDWLTVFRQAVYLLA